MVWNVNRFHECTNDSMLPRQHTVDPFHTVHATAMASVQMEEIGL